LKDEEGCVRDFNTKMWAAFRCLSCLQQLILITWDGGAWRMS